MQQWAVLNIPDDDVLSGYELAPYVNPVRPYLAR